MHSPVCLQFNCGFARTAIRELTPLGKRPSNNSIVTEFRQLFGDVPNFGVTDCMFECSHHWKESKFVRTADIVIQQFAGKWRQPDGKKKYQTSFCIANWKQLTQKEKSNHTLSNCTEYYSKYGNLQRIYPTKPTYLHGVEEASSTYIECDTSKQNDGADSEIEEKRKESQVMLKMKYRTKKVKDKLEAQYKKDDIDMVIGNRMSWSKYNKMRLSQSFETREEALLRTTTKGIIERRHGVTTENLAMTKRHFYRRRTNGHQISTSTTGVKLETSMGLPATTEVR